MCMSSGYVPSEHSDQSSALLTALAGIDAAEDEAALRAEFEQAVQFIRSAGRAGAAGAELAAASSGVLRGCVASAARLVAADQPWTWYVSGSVARGEAAPRSDVETLVVLADGADNPAMQARAAEAHALLERCGVRVDANGVLASRPRFCRTETQWSEGIARWTTDPREDRGVVMTGVLADSVAVFGPLAQDALRRQVVRGAAASYPARQYLLQDATSLRAVVPSRLKMLTTQSDTVDVKLAVMDPVVKIARWAGLSAGSTVNSTLARLDSATKVLDAEDISSLRDSFTWLLRQRWEPSWNGDVVAMSKLPPQQRATLRSVARDVVGISRKLNYLASVSAFR